MSLLQKSTHTMMCEAGAAGHNTKKKKSKIFLEFRQSNGIRCEIVFNG
jgi:hypothetical protein